jgi:hypothetical protein
MDVEEARNEDSPPVRSKAMHRFMVALNCGMLVVGSIGGPLISRLYFSKGGQRQLALRVAGVRGLAAAASAHGGVLLRPPRARCGRPGRARPAAHPAGRGGARPRHRRRQLRLQLRARLHPRVHLLDPHLDAARVLRVPRRAAAVHRRIRERRHAGAARLRRPPRGGHQGAVLVGHRPHYQRRRTVWTHPAARRARVQARRGRRAHSDIRAGDGGAAGDGVLRHRALHRRHDHQQGLPGACPRVVTGPEF